MGNLRTCTVSFCEPKGTGRFSVEVTAESTFEAAVRALKIFRQEEWCTEAVYATGYLEISVKSPVVEYKILLDIKGRSSRRLQEEFPSLRKRYWGQHLWARGYFCATVGAVDEETIFAGG